MWPFTSSQPAIGRDVKSLYDTYDYIIVGGGTAGCVLARRLSDYEGHTVLLVEKGDARDSWLDRIPLFSSHHFGDKKHSTVIQVHDEHVERTVDVIAGLGLGGSTRVNGCQFTCGVPGEYNAWAQAGNEGWSYDDIKPYLKKFETWHGPVTREYHGTDGPLQVRSFEGYAYSTAGKMQQAAEHIGFHRIEDLHSPFEPSFGVNKVPYTIGPDGTRQSAARAYLPTHLVQERSSRLHICTHAIGARVLLSSNEDGTTKADHVLVQSVTSEEKRMISAKREIVLTCGTLITPQVLMLSGIGPAAHLREMAIDPIVDLPGVGEHLQDHLYLPTSYNCPLPDSLWGAFRWPPTLIREIYRYVRYGSGYLLGTLCESEVLGISSLVGDDGIPLPHTKERESSADPANLPDFALLSTGIADPSSPGMDRSQGTYAILCALLRPKSLGRVRLSSSNARDQPKIDLRYLSDASDYAPLRAALRVSLALGRTMREDGYPLRPVLVPSSSSDAELDAFIRKHSTSMSHFTSTCRMAPDGVVDKRLRVRGVSGLRIADASVIPQATAAVHPQSLVYVIAEKCADMVLKDAA